MCGNSDPGTSGVLSPFSKLDGFYFDPSNEKDDFMYQLQKDLIGYAKEKNIQYIRMDFENEHDFYQALTNLEKYTEENVKLSGTSRMNHFEIVVDILDDEPDVEKEENRDERNR